MVVLIGVKGGPRGVASGIFWRVPSMPYVSIELLRRTTHKVINVMGTKKRLPTASASYHKINNEKLEAHIEQETEPSCDDYDAFLDVRHGYNTISHAPRSVQFRYILHSHPSRQPLSLFRPLYSRDPLPPVLRIQFILHFDFLVCWDIAYTYRDFWFEERGGEGYPRSADGAKL